MDHAENTASIVPYCLGVFTAPLHSNDRGADHIENNLSIVEECLPQTCLYRVVAYQWVYTSKYICIYNKGLNKEIQNILSSSHLDYLTFTKRSARFESRFLIRPNSVDWVLRRDSDCMFLCIVRRSYTHVASEWRNVSVLWPPPCNRTSIHVLLLLIWEVLNPSFNPKDAYPHCDLQWLFCAPSRCHHFLTHLPKFIIQSHYYFLRDSPMNCAVYSFSYLFVCVTTFE
jgi:hypothetical protein